MIRICKGSQMSDSSSCVGFVTESGSVHKGSSLGSSYAIGYVMGPNFYTGSRDWGYPVGYIKGTMIYKGSLDSDLSHQVGYASDADPPELVGGAAFLLGLFADEFPKSCPRCGSGMLQSHGDWWNCRRCGHRFDLLDLT